MIRLGVVLTGVLVATLSGATRPSVSASDQQGSAARKRMQIATDRQIRGTVDVERVREWIAAVRGHAPAKMDPPATSIEDWPDEALAVTITDVVALTRMVRFLDATRTGGSDGVAQKYRERLFTLTPSARADTKAGDVVVLDELLGLAPGERIPQVNHLLELGAMLHTDLGARNEPSSKDLSHAGSLDGQHPKRMGMLDGHVVSIIDNAQHWTYARFLLDAVDERAAVSAPRWEDVDTDPARVAFVARWYRATIAWLQSQGRWADADPQMAHALEIFPGDARLWFYAGVMHELFAEPQIQQAAQEMIRSGFVQQVVAEPKELDIAARDLQRAVTLDPGFAEAHLHLGRVLGRQGNHAEAVSELMLAARSIDGGELQYDTRMLLAREQESAGDQVSAKANIERAAALFPRAQSPRLALSELLHHGLDPGAAQAPIDGLLQRPSDQTERVDPWWNYTRSHVRDAGAQLDGVWRELTAETAR